MAPVAHEPSSNGTSGASRDEALRQALSTAESVNFKLDVDTGRATIIGAAPQWITVEVDAPDAINALFDAVHVDDRSRFSLDALSSLPSGVVQEGIFRVVAENGNIRRLRARIRLLRDDNDKPRTVFGVLSQVDASPTAPTARPEVHGRREPEAGNGSSPVVRLATLEEALAGAVRRGELSVAYQPIVDIWAERPTAAEALARWRHPELGNVPPDEFIPVAERSGQIVELGAWVLGQACRDLASWDAPPGFSVCVNVSGRQLLQPGLEAAVAGSLAATGVRAGQLCLEITESVLMDDGLSTAAALERLRDLGLRIAIDDFGTGYSSLLYLRDYPAQLLKIDQRFVAGVTAGLEDLAIVRATIELAHALGMVALAEGVETPEQMTILRTLGCDLAQGFLWSRAVPADELAAMLVDPGRRRLPAVASRQWEMPG